MSQRNRRLLCGTCPRYKDLSGFTTNYKILRKHVWKFAVLF